MTSTATRAPAKSAGKATTARQTSTTVRLHRATMMGGARIVRTHTYVSVLPDGVERTALRTSTSVPVARASMVGAAMVRMSTDVAAHQDGKATTVTWTLT